MKYDKKAQNLSKPSSAYGGGTIPHTSSAVNFNRSPDSQYRNNYLMPKSKLTTASKGLSLSEVPGLNRDMYAQ